MGLTERERAILDVERSWWVGEDPPATKEQAIKDRLGLSATRYYALLADLIDRPAARVEDPLLVRRLQRNREQRRRAKFEGRPTGDPGSR